MRKLNLIFALSMERVEELNDIWRAYQEATGGASRKNPVRTGSNKEKTTDLIPNHVTQVGGLNNFIYPCDGITCQGGLLVVGLNPSVVLKDDVFNEQMQSESIKGSYASKGKSVASKKEAGNVDMIDYFSRLRAIAEAAGFSDFNYTDLLKIRHTSSSDIEKAHRDLFAVDEQSEVCNNVPVAGNPFRDFIAAQIKLTLDDIRRANPDVILLNNALASNILLAKRNADAFSCKDDGYEAIRDLLEANGFELVWKEEWGTYCWNNGTKQVPVFLSGMASSGCLDNGSAERLAWDIRHVMQLIEAAAKPA